MTEEKRGPGRPPKVRPEAAPALTEQEVRTAIASTLDPEVTLKPALADLDRMIEVELKRKYAPGRWYQDGEIMKTVPAGTVMELPVAEATRALKRAIAVATDRTFNNG